MPPELITKVVPVVVIEPLGSNSLYSSMALNMPWKEMHGQEIEGVATDIDIEKIKHGSKIAHLRNPKTRVKFLGATAPSPESVSRIMMRNGEVICVCVPDEMMMSAAISFAGNATPLSHLHVTTNGVC